MTRVKKYSYRTRNATRKEGLSVVSSANIVDSQSEKRPSRRLLGDGPPSSSREKFLKAGNRTPRGSLRTKHTRSSFLAGLYPAGTDSDKIDETLNNNVNRKGLKKVATADQNSRDTHTDRKKEQNNPTFSSPKHSDPYTRSGRIYTTLNRVPKRVRNKAGEGTSPSMILEDLSETVHPGTSFTTRHQRQQKAMSNRAQSISPRQSQTCVPSLRQPVILPKRSTPHNETDSELSDADDLEIDYYALRRSTSIVRNSTLTREGSLHPTGATLPRNLERTQFLDETEKLQSDASGYDSDTPLAKRRKVSATAADDEDCRSFDEVEQNKSSFYTSCSSNPANLEASQSPLSESEATNIVNNTSPGPFHRAPIAPMMPNMSFTVPGMSAISAQSENNNDNSNERVIAVLNNVDTIPARPHEPRIFSKIVEQMRKSFIAKDSTSGPSVFRWITDPSSPNGPPIPEKAQLREGTVYRDNTPNMPPAWRTSSGNRRICTVEDIPNIVARVYCSPQYINQKHLISTLLQDFSGICDEDVTSCLAGVSVRRASTKEKPVTPRPDGDESAPVLLVSTQLDTGDAPANDCSSSTYMSPPVSQDEGSPHITESATTSQTASSDWPISATADAGTQTSSPSPCVHRNNHPIIKLSIVHTERVYARSLERDSELKILKDLAQEKTDEQERRIRMLQNDIDEIARSSAVLRNRLAPDRRQSMGVIIDEDKAEKEGELESLTAERVKALEDMGKCGRERIWIRKNLDAFVCFAKAHREDIVTLLAFIDGLPAPQSAVTDMSSSNSGSTCE